MQKIWGISDETWQKIDEIIDGTPRVRVTVGGRKPRQSHDVLCGILFVLSTGVGWRQMPLEMGYGSGMTCLRRLKEWNRNGTWAKLKELLLAEWKGANKVDWSRAALVSGGSVESTDGENEFKPKSKVRLVTDSRGRAIAVKLTAWNELGETRVIPLARKAVIDQAVVTEKKKVTRSRK